MSNLHPSELAPASAAFGFGFKGALFALDTARLS
jgi:hypothetical protein